LALRLLRGRGPRRIARDIVLQLRALRILRCLGRRKLSRALGALPLERVVAAGVKRHLPALQMQNMVDHIVQQIALMADHHHHRRIAFEKAFEPERRFEV
jgi:hypothetical protein